MNLFDNIQEHFAISTGVAITTLLAPLPDVITRIVVGVISGVLIFCITKTISWLGSKLKETLKGGK